MSNGASWDTFFLSWDASGERTVKGHFFFHIVPNHPDVAENSALYDALLNNTNPTTIKNKTKKAKEIIQKMITN